VRSKFILPREEMREEEGSTIEEEAEKEASKEETSMDLQEETLETDLEDASTVAKKAT
jgi:hypothetical protein